MLRPPGGGTGLELSSFIRPDHEPGSPDPMHNELGLRNVTFEVDDLQAILDRLAADGYRLVGGVGQYEGIWRMASVRGPEGFIVNLASQSPDPSPVVLCLRQFSGIRISAVAAAGLGAGSQAPDAADASGIARLRVLFRHAAASAPDAQAGPP